jgi:shikimate dehydrogenase
MKLPMAISGATRVAGVIGDPVRHSLSPALYNAAFAALDLDWQFVAFEVASGHGGDAVDAMRTLRLAGLSVTMPHKEDVIPRCDVVTQSAAALRSVNHLRWDGDRIVGDSTDGVGFVRSLADAAVDPAGARVLLLGAGGAARAVAVALRDAGSLVTCLARRREAASEVAALCGGRSGDLADAGVAAADHDLVVNSTPVGMGDDVGLALPAAALRADLVVADLVYHPLDTPLLVAARAAGARTVDGLGMLVHQAAVQFEHWTGATAPIAAMRTAAENQLALRR